VQKETAEADQRKLEVILKRDHERQAFIQQKEQEILQLQVRCCPPTPLFLNCPDCICSLN
jgi:hypothetical protein